MKVRKGTCYSSIQHDCTLLELRIAISLPLSAFLIETLANTLATYTCTLLIKKFSSPNINKVSERHYECSSFLKDVRFSSK